MFISEKHWFQIFCIYQIQAMCHQVYAASISGLLEMDSIHGDEQIEFDDEDSAKEQLIYENGYEWSHLNHFMSLPLHQDIRQGTRLCTNEWDRFAECKRGRDNWPLCFGERSGVIKACSKLIGKDAPIPVCRANDDRSVITCGKFSTAPLCYVDDKTQEICEGPNDLQLCLTERGTLRQCKDYDKDNSISGEDNDELKEDLLGSESISEVSKGDKPTTEDYNDNKKLAEIYNDDKQASEDYNDNEKVAEVYNDDKQASEDYNNDELMAEDSNDDERTSEFLNYAEPKTEHYNDNEQTAEYYNNDDPMAKDYNDEPTAEDYYFLEMGRHRRGRIFKRWNYDYGEHELSDDSRVTMPPTKCPGRGGYI